MWFGISHWQFETYAPKRNSHNLLFYNGLINHHMYQRATAERLMWVGSSFCLLRKQNLLPIPYFHVIFTLPEQLRPLALPNQNTVYNILFKAASETLKELAADPKHLGADIGFITILHTWSQTLLHHPHLHCVVTGGGLSPDENEWIAARNAFFVHVKLLSRLFRGKLLAFLKNAYGAGELIFPGKIAYLTPQLAFNALLSNLYQIDLMITTPHTHHSDRDAGYSYAPTPSRTSCLQLRTPLPMTNPVD